MTTTLLAISALFAGYMMSYNRNRALLSGAALVVIMLDDTRYGIFWFAFVPICFTILAAHVLSGNRKATAAQITASIAVLIAILYRGFDIWHFFQKPRVSTWDWIQIAIFAAIWIVIFIWWKPDDTSTQSTTAGPCEPQETLVIPDPTRDPDGPAPRQNTHPQSPRPQGNGVKTARPRSSDYRNRGDTPRRAPGSSQGGSDKRTRRQGS